MFNMAYTTPQAVYRQLSKALPALADQAMLDEYADTTALIRDYCVQASAYISTMTQTYFVPYKNTLEYYLVDESLRRSASRGVIYLPEYLLQVDEVKQNNVVIASTGYRLNSSLFSPAIALRFTSELLYTISFNTDDVISIEGLWGYSSNYTNAYTRIETIAGSLTATATSLTVADASLYEELQYLLLDDELVQVTALNTSTDVLTLMRGVNGTTASAHSAFDVLRFDVETTIKLAATKLTAFMYQKRNDTGGTVQFADGASTVNDLAPFVDGIVDMYRRNSLSAV